MRKTLKDYGYPHEGVMYLDLGGGDTMEYPQEAWSAYTCDSCGFFDHKDEICKRTGEDKDPDTDTCDKIDYKGEFLDCSYGFRSPIRCEYSTDKAYQQACKAIQRMNAVHEDEL